MLERLVRRVKVFFLPRPEEPDYEALRQAEYEAELWLDKWMNKVY